MSRAIQAVSNDTLAAQARAGDRSAFETLCERMLPMVYNRLRAQLPLEAVEDVTQEVFVAATRGIRRFRGRSSFRTWLAGIARHKVADYYRKRPRHQSIGLAEGKAFEQPSQEHWQEHAQVRIALAQLPEHYREILLLRFAEGLPFEGVAQRLGISLEAAKSRYRRAVAAAGKAIGCERAAPARDKGSDSSLSEIA